MSRNNGLLDSRSVVPLSLRSLVIVTSLLIVLSGCAGDAPKPAAVVTTDELGGIRGSILNEELSPVGGAAIGIRQSATSQANNTVSSADGKFTFSQLQPGEWELVVQAAFYDASVRKVTVVAGEVAEINVGLKRVAQQNATAVLIEGKEDAGFISFSYSFPWTSGDVLSGSIGQGSPNEKSHFPLIYNEKMDLKEVLFEIVWQPGTAGSGAKLQISICNKGTVKDEQNNCFNVPDSPAYSKRTQGASPLVLRVDDLPLKDHKEYTIAIGDGGGGAVTFQQQFKLYTSVCYNQKCPTEYQMRPPA